MTYTISNSRGQTYYLHGKNVILKNGRDQRIYFFAKTVKDDALDALPDGYMVSENSQTGLPVLKKIRTPASA